jgi:DNA-binding response OmpR family regulator
MSALPIPTGDTPPRPAEANPARFLVIEDHDQLAHLVRQCLAEQDYAVDVLASGRDGEEAAARGVYDGIVLDLMLPDHNGLDLCRNLRRRGVSTPVLMLTALDATLDKVAGLDAGADDYLAKPFEVDELVARARALLRRAHAGQTVLRFHDLEMNLVKRSVTRAGKTLSLTAREFSLLEFFMRNPNRVLTRTCLGERLWDMAFEAESNVVEVTISRLRRRVDRGFTPSLIRTVIGSGYVLSATPVARAVN